MVHVKFGALDAQYNVSKPRGSGWTITATGNNDGFGSFRVKGEFGPKDTFKATFNTDKGTVRVKVNNSGDQPKVTLPTKGKAGELVRKLSDAAKDSLKQDALKLQDLVRNTYKAILDAMDKVGVDKAKIKPLF